MSALDANPPPDAAGTPPRRTRPWLLTGVGALAAGLATGLLSTDWCFATLKAILLGAIMGRLVEALAGSERLRARHLPLRLRVAVVAILGLALAPLFRLDQGATFERAFGVRPPPGITNLTMERHYMGGPGDEATLIRFHADPGTIQQLLTQAGLKEDMNVPLLLAERAWPAFWEELFFGLCGHYGGSAWSHVAPITGPKVYRGARGMCGETVLLWDPVTGQVYAVYRLG